MKVTDPATGVQSTVRKVIRRGLARKCLNKLVSRIKRMYAWAVEEELVPVAVHAALVRVKGLKKGKSAARETPRVRPVAEDHVRRVMAVVTPAVRAMIEVQWLCGCRPQDVVQMRPCDIDRAGGVWEYRPPRFKTEYHNDDGPPDLDRVVYLGPKAQAVLTPLLPADADAYVFSPQRSEASRNAGRRAARETPLTPSQAGRNAKGRAKAPLRPHYPVGSYRQAIRRGCKRACRFGCPTNCGTAGSPRSARGTGWKPPAWSAATGRSGSWRSTPSKIEGWPGRSWAKSDDRP